ncbi:preprotein translocase subunit YajC [Tissierella sp. MB52-C2]|uniref:preprotein translocase subunit YajC n=1 Tax=Tissierella sp. MB52-C2 TaxID=3070999 RepID=UPI00280A84BA|nr:preprotein translocase subunit YajC [Tissierella sp. MB52-C2]WMM26837.1 preprotein translocase subunit YajC [Tissierella sp. MB52-C2]
MPQQLQGLILPIGFFVLLYFMMIRPQKKKEQQIREMRDALRVGDQVVTIGGIYGKILKVKEDVITIEVGSAKTKLEMTKWSIGSVVSKNELKDNKDEEVKTEDDKE